MEELGGEPDSAWLTRPGGRAQVAVLVQTAREDGRAVHAAAGAGGASASRDPAAEEVNAEELGEDWTSEQLSDAALLISSVLAAHAAGSPPVSGLSARSGIECSKNV